VLRSLRHCRVEPHPPDAVFFEPSVAQIAKQEVRELYRNRGDGTFDDVTATSSIGSAEWAIGGAYFDNDDKLDLFVVNYVRGRRP
jgi:hypothetical protein